MPVSAAMGNPLERIWKPGCLRCFLGKLANLRPGGAEGYIPGQGKGEAL